MAVHGTGTPLGDPIEVGALGQALSAASAAASSLHSNGTATGNGSGSGAGHRVTLASVKSCYGHTEGAAGLTGALLAVSSLQAQVHRHLLHEPFDFSCTLKSMHGLMRIGACSLCRLQLVQYLLAVFGHARYQSLGGG